MEALSMGRVIRMPNLKDFALNMINGNPNVANNPNAQEFLNVIRNNDDVRGKQIAKNLCDSYGLTTDQAIQQAKRFFGLP